MIHRPIELDYWFVFKAVNASVKRIRICIFKLHMYIMNYFINFNFLRLIGPLHQLYPFSFQAIYV